MLMRAGYEARHRDCADAEIHLTTVITKKPRWAEAEALRLICERSEFHHFEERQTLTKLLQLQPGNWQWWRDRAHVNADMAAYPEAIADISTAIQMRPWDPELYNARCSWKAALRQYPQAYADAEMVHKLIPSSGVTLEWMAQHAVDAGKSEEEAQRLHELAELNPEALPFKTRADEDLPVGSMTNEELLLRAGYAERVHKDQLALRFVNVALTRIPDWEPAVWMHYQLLLRGVGLREVTPHEVESALELPKQMKDLQRRQGLTAAQNARALANDRIPQEARTQANRIAGDIDHLIRVNPLRADYLRIRIAWDTAQEAARDYSTIIAIEPYVAANYIERAIQEEELASENPNALVPGRTRPGPPPMVAEPKPPPPRGIPYAPLQTAAAPPDIDGSEATWPTNISSNVYSTQALSDAVRAVELAPGDPKSYLGLARAYDSVHAGPFGFVALNMALIGDPDNPDLRALRPNFP